MRRQTKLSDLENRRLRQEKELADLEQKLKDLEGKITRKKEDLGFSSLDHVRVFETNAANGRTSKKSKQTGKINSPSRTRGG